MMSNTRIARFAPLFLFLASLATGALLRPIPTSPDAHFGASQVAGTFLLFLAWATGVFCLGRTLGRWIDGSAHPPLYLVLASGTAAASLIYGVAGIAGFVGFENGRIAWGLLLLFVLTDSGRISEASRKRKLVGWERALELALLAALGLTAFTNVLKAGLAHGYGDPLLYHLVGPRDWAQAGKIYFNPRLSYAFQSSAWEYLYGWGATMLGEPGGRGLIETQLFGQWIHAVMGFGGCLLATYALVLRISANPIWAAGAALSLSSSETLRSLAPIAKNDWGIMFWVLAAAALLTEDRPGSKRGVARDVAGGMLIGLSFVTKITMGWSALLLGLYLPWRGTRGQPKERARVFLRVAGGCFLAILPFVVRNLLATGNPFYPHLANLIPGVGVSPVMKLALQQASPKLVTSFSFFRDSLLEILKDSPLNWGVPLAFLVVGRDILQSRKKKKGARPLWLGGFLLAWLACIAWYPLIEIRQPLVRWVGLGLFAGPILVLWAFLSLFRGPVATAVAGLAVFLASLPTIDPTVTISVWNAPSADKAIREPSVHIAGSAKAWLRLNTKPGEKVITTGDNQLYYLMGLDAFPVLDDPAYAQAMLSLNTPREIISYLHRQGFAYLLDSRSMEGRAWTPLAKVVHGIVLADKVNAAAIAFRGEGSVVLHIPTLAVLANETP